MRFLQVNTTCAIETITIETTVASTSKISHCVCAVCVVVAYYSAFIALIDVCLIQTTTVAMFSDIKKVSNLKQSII